MSGAGEGLARREALSAAKRALLEQRLRGEDPSAPVVAPATTAATAGLLSPGQERLWFLQHLAPESSAYNMPQAFRLRGVLDAAALERSFDHVVLRHEVLRTVFPAADGKPVPANCTRPFRLAHGDLSTLPREEREREATARVDAEARLPFDLAAGPLMRALLLRLAEDDHILLIVLHHIVCDEWSLDLLWHEVASCYGAGGEVPPTLAPLPLQYGDYAAQQRVRLEGDRLQAALEHWRVRLAGSPSRMELPYDRPLGRRRARRGALATADMPATLTTRVQELARAEAATPFVVLLSAFKTLLYRITTQADVIVGAPFTGRVRRELEGVIGFFINSVVLRTDLSGDPSFTEVVRRVRATVMDAFAHQEVPFEQLVDALRPAREPHQNPLFQVMFVLQRSAQVPQFMPALRATPHAVHSGGAKLDLTLFLTEPGHGPLQTALEYDSDLFDRATAERLLLQMRVLLEAAVQSPRTSISRLALLPESELHRIREWESGPQVDLPHDTVHAWIAAQTRRSPSALAVISDDARLTYAELRSRAHVLAQRLRASGAGPNVCVGLCAERSSDMVVGMLAILEAGAAYVPIDPAYPDSRIRFALEDTDARVVLAQRGQAARVASLAPRAQVLELSDTESDENDVADAQLVHHADVPGGACADDLAYVIHTSGSTGRPKGVRVTHRNLVQSTAARLIHYAESPARFLLLSSFAFDSSVAGIFWTLCTGGTLVLPPGRAEQDVRGLAQRIQREAVTHTLLLPSLHALLLEHASAAALASLRCVIVAGEPCSAGVATAHHARLPLTVLYNEYGPTEATVWSTAHRVEPENPGGRVPIGRPVPGARVHVLDAQLQRVPIGVAGELYIGGGGVAAGYQDRASETAASFVADVFSGEPAARLYRTGDRGRWTPAGVLEFLGRTDEQVKIRGHRIERGEIRAILEQHPGVRESAVTIRPQTVPATTDALFDALNALGPAEAELMLSEVEQEDRS